MNEDATVKVVKCERCPGVVGKLATVQKMVEDDNGDVKLKLNFGKGRPTKGRPEFFQSDEVEQVDINRPNL